VALLDALGMPVADGPVKDGSSSTARASTPGPPRVSIPVRSDAASSSPTR
jgi:hypothetical protein